ncbi:hypothetical protein M378DRAFT_156306 [Amanita muscaria Koide BX008]|uniref:Uncharacterized protein n=1 Tax=Amanita muscaria (strain Koide BX008) TaxID=946122 RepID=A0A0C2T2Y0_AMAMK|nr:hypothetical protein M378DRAFT_156306 [Amanita muscaria Koide BX008]
MWDTGILVRVLILSIVSYILIHILPEDECRTDIYIGHFTVVESRPIPDQPALYTQS